MTRHTIRTTNRRAKQHEAEMVYCRRIYPPEQRRRDLNRLLRHGPVIRVSVTGFNNLGDALRAYEAAEMRELLGN